MAEGIYRGDADPVAVVANGKNEDHEFRLAVYAHRAHDDRPARIVLEEQARELDGCEYEDPRAFVPIEGPLGGDIRGDDDCDDDCEECWFEGETLDVDVSAIDALIAALQKAKDEAIARSAKKAVRRG